jgi:hypothetical protein
MISATEMFLQQYHLMADGLRAGGSRARGRQKASHGYVLYCTFRASPGPYAAPAFRGVAPPRR